VNELTITVQTTSLMGFACRYEDEFIQAARMAAESLRSMHGITAFFSVETEFNEPLYENTTKVLVNGKEVCNVYLYEEKYRDPDLLAAMIVEEALRMFGREEAYAHYGISSRNYTLVAETPV